MSDVHFFIFMQRIILVCMTKPTKNDDVITCCVYISSDTPDEWDVGVQSAKTQRESSNTEGRSSGLVCGWVAPFITLNLGICIAPIQPFRAALGTKSRVCYGYCLTGTTADRQTQWALSYYHLSQSTANQNGKLIHCHRWDSNLWSSGC
jgi:hypothetical protein